MTSDPLRYRDHMDNMNEHQSIDLSVERDLDQFEISEELRRNYVKRRLSDLTDVEAALKSQNFDQLMCVGHKIRGSAASFRYPDLESLAIAMEAAGEQRDFLNAFEIARDFRKWILNEMCRPWFLQKTADF